MSERQSTAREDETSRETSEDSTSNLVATAILRGLYAIRSSFFVFTICLGVVLVLMGGILNQGAVAGLLGILGVFWILYGLIGFGFIRLIQY